MFDINRIRFLKNETLQETLNRLSEENRMWLLDALTFRQKHYKATGKFLGFDYGFLKSLGVY